MTIHPLQRVFASVVSEFAPRLHIYCPGERKTKKNNKTNKTVRLGGMMTGAEAWAILNNYNVLLQAVSLQQFESRMTLYVFFQTIFLILLVYGEN